MSVGLVLTKYCLSVDQNVSLVITSVNQRLIKGNDRHLTADACSTHGTNHLITAVIFSYFVSKNFFLNFLSSC